MSLTGKRDWKSFVPSLPPPSKLPERGSYTVVHHSCYLPVWLTEPYIAALLLRRFLTQSKLDVETKTRRQTVNVTFALEFLVWHIKMSKNGLTSNACLYYTGIVRLKVLISCLLIGCSYFDSIYIFLGTRLYVDCTSKLLDISVFGLLVMQCSRWLLEHALGFFYSVFLSPLYCPIIPQINSLWFLSILF